MRVLWLTNIPMAAFCELNGISVPSFGGWLFQTSKLLENHYEILYSFPIDEDKEMYNANKKYFPFLKKLESKKLEEFFYSILEECKPDLVHIHGTEYTHSYYMAQCCKEKKIKFVVSIQGLAFKVSEHYYYGLPLRLIKKKSLLDPFFLKSISSQKKIFEARGKYELKLLEISDFVIGRTEWDKYIVESINNNVQYFHCDEILREGFYQIDTINNAFEKNRIFLTQGNYPIKGLHYLLRALKIIKSKGIKFNVVVAGSRYYEKNLLKKFLKPHYISYSDKLVIDFNLTDEIVYTGLISESEIIKEFKKSSIFICPSTIENSSNSICEAMMLGIPVLASNVGGIPTLIKDGHDGVLYPFNEPEILAEKIIELLNNDELHKKISKNSIHTARRRHDIDENISQIKAIYEMLKSF